MKKVFMIHGFQGRPNEGWRPWLMSKLAHAKVWACALAMPKADNPNKDEWVKEIERMIEKPNKDIFLVGHSLGVPTILNYLQSLPTGASIGGVILVSGPVRILPAIIFRPIHHFMDTPFDFEHIKKVCKKFSVIHGDNDSLVPFKHAVELSEDLGCELISVHGGGHLNEESDCYELP